MRVDPVRRSQLASVPVQPAIACPAQPPIHAAAPDAQVRRFNKGIEYTVRRIITVAAVMVFWVGCITVFVSFVPQGNDNRMTKYVFGPLLLAALTAAFAVADRSKKTLAAFSGIAVLLGGAGFNCDRISVPH